MLTPEQLKLREDKVTASFIPNLMAGKAEEIGREWQRLTGHPDYVPLDLADKWAPMFGSYVEPFAIDWHERKTGLPLTRRQEWVLNPTRDYVGSTIDCWREFDDMVIDCKCPLRWSKLENTLSFYPGQLVVQRDCTNARRAALLIVHGGDEPEEHEVQWDEDYEGEVWGRIDWFWQRVQTLQPPCAIPGVKAPIINAARVVDMNGNNSWADFAATWLRNRDQMKAWKCADAGLKELMEADVSRAFGHGIVASRAKTGAVTIRGEKST